MLKPKTKIIRNQTCCLLFAIGCFAIRSTMEKVTAGGKVDQVDKEVERGKVV